MSSATVLKKGAPSRSYPSRQRKLGPAPFASFEDLSDELESPSPAGEGGASGNSGTNGAAMLPGIGEEDCHDPDDHVLAHHSHRPVTATSSGSTVTFAAMSQPTSGLQTPSTPRIDISCASSSTPPESEESEEGSEKELFQGGLGYAFHEEGNEELRSSAEELDLGGEVLELDSEEEKRQKKREKEAYSEDIYRRASTPANIFYRRKSSNTMGQHGGSGRENHEYYERDDDLHRKPSAHTLFLDGLLSRPAARHASFGNSEFGRPGALSSMSAHSSGSIRGKSRSPSPHKLMFETSFCGAKPIPTKSMEVEEQELEKIRSSRSHSSPPTVSLEEKDSLLTIITSSTSPSPPTATNKPKLKLKPQILTKPPKSPKPSSHLQEQVVDHVIQVHANAERSERSLSIKSLTTPGKNRSRTPDPTSPTLSTSTGGGGGDSRRPSYGRRSVSPFKMVYETSFCGSKPIPTKSMEVPDSPPKNGGGNGPTDDLSAFLLSQTTQVQVHADSQVRGQSISGPPTRSRPLSPSSPKSSDHWRPITPKSDVECGGGDLSPLPPAPGSGSGRAVSEESSPSMSTSTAKYVSTPNPAQNLKLQTSNIFKWPEPTPEQKAAKSSSKEISSDNQRFSHDFSPPQPQPHPRPEPPQESIEPTIKLGPDSVEEAKFLHPDLATDEAEMDADDEDGDLPYVPTTLPMEKSSIELHFPSKERRSSEGLTPLSRPKVVRPPNPASINDYIAYASEGGAGIDKMKINLPREDSLGGGGSSGGYTSIGGGGAESGATGGDLARNSPVKKKGSIGATNWADFAEMGLRSPRELRRKMREENGEED